MKACVIKPHHAGLFSLINNVVTCLDLYDHVYVDWSTGCIYNDAWPSLFEPRPIPKDVPVECIDIINEYPHQALTYKNAGNLYKLKNSRWREKFNRLWNRLIVRPGVLQAALDFHSSYSPYNAILVRSHNHAGEQLTDRSQALEEYADALNKWGIWHRGRLAPVFVMAGDNETMDWFRQRFDVIEWPHTKRAATRDIDRHLVEPQTIEDARNCLIEVMIASRAQLFIHPVSNMATAALYMNPALPNIFLE